MPATSRDGFDEAIAKPVIKLATKPATELTIKPVKELTIKPVTRDRLSDSWCGLGFDYHCFDYHCFD